MKNILQVINLFSSAENFIGSQFLYFKEKGYEMHLICSPAERLDSFAKNQKIEYEAIELNRQVSIINDLKALIKICRYIKKHKIDIIIGHQAKGRLLTILAGKIMGVPKIIIFAHGVIFETSTGLKRELLRLENKFESICANKVVCVSDSVRKKRLAEKIDNPSKQVILGKGTCGGIDTVNKFNPNVILNEKKISLREKLGITEDDLVIGFCGRLVKDKGVPELIEGYKLLKQKHQNKNIKLMIVGSLEKRDSISNDILEYMRSSPDIVFTGFVDGNMELYYSIMSLLILPSYREGFPTAVLEGSSMELPILTTKSTGCIDSIIDGETGYFVDIEPVSICDGVEKLFNKKQRKQLGENGRKWVSENFDHNKVWPYIEKLFVKV